MLKVNDLYFIRHSDFNRVDYYMFNIDYTTNDLTRNIKGTVIYDIKNGFRILETSSEISENKKSDIAMLFDGVRNPDIKIERMVRWRDEFDDSKFFT